MTRTQRLDESFIRNVKKIWPNISVPKATKIISSEMLEPRIKRKGRRAQIDLFNMALIIFLIALGIVVAGGSLLSLDTNDGFGSGPLSQVEGAFTIADFGFLLIIIGVTLVSTYLNYYQATDKMAIGLNMMIVAILVSFAGTLTDVFVKTTGLTTYDRVRVLMPILFYIMNNFAYFIYILALLNIYALFGKSEKEEAVVFGDPQVPY